MSTTLPHGIIQINEGNISWYGDITANWQLIDSKIGEYDATVASIPAPANTGTLTINYGGTTIAMFGADDAGNVSADIPAPGDGTLTIQLNGVDVQTFTANASANATANIQCVDLTNNQTVGGVKNFSGTLSVTKPIPRLQMKSTTYSSETSSAMTIGDIALLNSNGSFSAWIVHQLRDDLTKRLCFRVHPHDGSAYKGFVFDDSCNLYPENTNSALGTSTNKWKTINGINPGALSLPGTSVNVDTTNWVLDGSNVNIFTPASDGWLGIQVTDTVYDQMHYVFVGRNDSASYYQQNVLSPINALWDGEYHGCVFIPVIKNVAYDIRCICDLVVATFYPCQGNV